MNNQNSSIKLFQLIKDQTNEQTAIDAVSVLQDTITDEVKTQTTLKFKDVKMELIDMFMELNGKMSGVQIELTEKIGDLRTELTGKMNNVQIELTEKIGDLRTELAGKMNNVKIELTEKMSDLRTELTGKMNNVKIELTEKIVDLRTELTGKINDLRAELHDVRFDLIDRINSSKIQTILWVVGMSVVQLLARYFFK